MSHFGRSRHGHQKQEFEHKFLHAVSALVQLPRTSRSGSRDSSRESTVEAKESFGRSLVGGFGNGILSFRDVLQVPEDVRDDFGNTAVSTEKIVIVAAAGGFIGGTGTEYIRAREKAESLLLSLNRLMSSRLK